MSQPAVDVRGVWKRYGDVDVVSDLSFDVHAGEVLGLRVGDPVRVEPLHGQEA